MLISQSERPERDVSSPLIFRLALPLGWRK